jgi:hypothetical protein
VWGKGKKGVSVIKDQRVNLISNDERKRRKKLVKDEPKSLPLSDSSQFFFFLRKNGNTSNWIHQDYFFLERERWERKNVVIFNSLGSFHGRALRRSSGTVVGIRAGSLATLGSTGIRIVVLDGERSSSRCSIGHRGGVGSRHSVIRFLLLLHLLLLVRFVLVIGLVQRGYFLLECFDTFLQNVHLGFVFLLDRLDPDAVLLVHAELARFELGDL